MAISVNAAAAAYIPQQAYSPQAGASVQASASQPANTPTPPQQAAAHANARSRSQANPNNTNNTNNTQQDQRAQNARRKSPAVQATSRPGYTFTVDLHNHRIMKVSDSKGVLIYQIPSKGQLALITAQEDKQRQLQLTA